MPHKDSGARNRYMREWQAAKIVSDPIFAQKQRDYSREYQRKRRAEDPDGVARMKRNSNLKRQYGITLEEYEIIESAQRGLCAICMEPETQKNQHCVTQLSVDHDHKRGKHFVRGLLCSSCNNGLGRFRDDPTLLRRAIAYLEGYELAMSRETG